MQYCLLQKTIKFGTSMQLRARLHETQSELKPF